MNVDEILQLLANTCETSSAYRLCFQCQRQQQFGCRFTEQSQECGSMNRDTNRWYRDQLMVQTTPTDSKRSSPAMDWSKHPTNWTSCWQSHCARSSSLGAFVPNLLDRKAREQMISSGNRIVAWILCPTLALHLRLHKSIRCSSHYICHLSNVLTLYNIRKA